MKVKAPAENKLIVLAVLMLVTGSWLVCQAAPRLLLAEAAPLKNSSDLAFDTNSPSEPTSPPVAAAAPSEEIIVPENKPAPTRSFRREIMITKKAAIEKVAQADPVTLPSPETLPPVMDTPSFLEIPTAPAESTLPEVTLYASAGANYFRNQEDLANVLSSYEGFKAPSTRLGAELRYDTRTTITAEYHSVPIHFDNASVAKASATANLTTLTAQGATKSNQFKNISWLYGVQLHDMPLPLFKNLTNDFSLRKMQLVNLSLGAKNISFVNEKTRTTIAGRVQYPLHHSTSGGGDLDIRPKFIFDTDIALEKRLGSRAWLGLHWSSQYFNLDYSYSDPSISASGKHSTFISGVELRLQFDF